MNSESLSPDASSSSSSCFSSGGLSATTMCARHNREQQCQRHCCHQKEATTTTIGPFNAARWRLFFSRTAQEKVFVLASALIGGGQQTVLTSAARKQTGPMTGQAKQHSPAKSVILRRSSLILRDEMMMMNNEMCQLLAHTICYRPNLLLTQDHARQSMTMWRGFCGFHRDAQCARSILPTVEVVVAN